MVVTIICDVFLDFFSRKSILEISDFIDDILIDWNQVFRGYDTDWWLFMLIERSEGLFEPLVLLYALQRVSTVRIGC